MASAKDILLRPIPASVANALVRKLHYSGKVVNNSQIHIGVYLNGKLEGAMQFGPSLDKRKLVGLVEGTLWNEFIELNRMAFSEALPRNSESRALGIAMRILRKHAPRLKWVVSFADGTQCGDGTIYRAAGFVLTKIKENDQIWAGPSGADDARFARMSLTDVRPVSGCGRQQEQAQALCNRVSVTKGKAITVVHGVAAPRGYSEGGGLNLQSIGTHSASLRPGIGSIETAARPGGGSSMKAYKDAGFKPLPGFQLRYLYFLDPTARERLTCAVLPFSEIERVGAGMYRGKTRVRSADSGTSAPTEGGGANPTRTLQIEERDGAPAT